MTTPTQPRLAIQTERLKRVMETILGDKMKARIEKDAKQRQQRLNLMSALAGELHARARVGVHLVQRSSDR